MAAFALLRLADLAAEPRYAESAEGGLRPMQALMAKYPLNFGQWLIALDYGLSASREITIVGDLEAADTQLLLEICTNAYRPHQVVAAGPTGSPEMPLLQNRSQVEDRATAYVCIDWVCRPPVTEPEALQTLVDS